MTTQCVVRAAERPSAAARELAPPEENETEIDGYSRYRIYDNVVGRGLAPAVRYRKFVKDYSAMFVGDGVPDIPRKMRQG